MLNFRSAQPLEKQRLITGPRLIGTCLGLSLGMGMMMTHHLLPRSENWLRAQFPRQQPVVTTTFQVCRVALISYFGLSLGTVVNRMSRTKFKKPTNN